MPTNSSRSSTVLEAVTKQFQSGEGAIQFAPEAIARSNADLLSTVSWLGRVWNTRV